MVRAVEREVSRVVKGLLLGDWGIGWYCIGGEVEGGIRRFVRSKVWQKGCWRSASVVGVVVDGVGVRFGVGAVVPMAVSPCNQTSVSINAHPSKNICIAPYVHEHKNNRTPTSCSLPKLP